MTIFNLHHGQMRPRPGLAGQMYFRPTTPKKALIFAPLRAGGQKVQYNADHLGNIEVNAPRHVKAMMELGWPIYDGDGREVRLDDLLWPNPGNTDSQYNRRIQEAMSRGGG